MTSLSGVTRNRGDRGDNNNNNNNIQDEILFECQCQPDDPLVASYMSLWSPNFGASPTGPASHRQPVWNRPGIDAIKNEL